MTSTEQGRSATASVKDVAAAAGVSLGTVSNVLNRPHLVAGATRARVERAIAELAFVRNESARQLRAGGSRTLAYVMLDARNPFFTDVAEGIELAAETTGSSLILCNSRDRQDREDAYLTRLREQRVQGILITPINPERVAAHASASAGAPPLVLVDRMRRTDPPDMCAVAVDDVLGGRIALEHLVERGHRRVAVIGGPATIGQVRDRLTGAREAWTEAGLDPAALLHLDTRALSFDEGRVAGERLAGLPASGRPTAVFCLNDLLAIGVLQHTVSTGRTVPDDLAIVGYDDIDFAAAAAVPLTSVRQPRHELGRRATELVLDEADNSRHVHERIVFTPELVARASTSSR